MYWGDVSRNGKKGINHMPWRFHQFDATIGEVVLKLLKHLPPEERGSVAKVARHFTMVLGSAWQAGDGMVGVLEGRWSGNYSDGKKPTAWTGSRQIFEQYLRQPTVAVKYGQCWVFSAILTSAYRYLGIPARSVTNFRSAHEHPPYDHFISSKDKDGSTWNFHVWGAWVEAKGGGGAHMGCMCW